MIGAIDLGRVIGLAEHEQLQLDELVSVYNYHRDKNAKKARYYEGHIPLSEVNLGIALPQGLAGLEIGCEWGGKTVDVLAGRSMFDGFVGANGYDPTELNRIVDANSLISEYSKHSCDALKG